LDVHQKSLIKGYYFLCVRYFYKSKSKSNIIHIKKSLKLFYSKEYLSFYSYLRGLSFLKFYEFGLISDELFIRLNRYFYK
jgi:hypothetical protein